MSGQDDRRRHAGSAALFGISLGVSTVVYPLLALGEGFGAAAIGGFTAVSAASQFGVRLALPAVLDRVTDRRVMSVAAMGLALSFAVLMASPTTAAFVFAQTLQGMARALFWTANQTHSVRGEAETTRNIARAQAFGTSGGLIGPIVGGALVAVSTSAALGTGVALAVVTAITAATLTHHDPYRRSRGRRPVWRIDGMGLSAWAGVAGGAWRGIVDSFVPVVATSAGVGADSVGVLVALADGSGFAATAAVARWNIEKWMTAIVAGSALAVATATAALAFAGDFATLAALSVFGGVGGGLGLVMAPAAATRVAVGDNQGAGIALAGTYRAAARFAAPAGVSSMMASAPLAAGLGAVGLLIAAPIVLVKRWVSA